MNYRHTDRPLIDNRRTARSLLWIPVALAGLVLPGCDGLFNVENPNDILEEELDNPDLIPALSNAAEGALSLSYEDIVIIGGLPGDGIIAASTNQGGVRPDRGIFDGFQEYTDDLWNSLASARWTATEVTGRLEALVENPASDMGLARSYFWDAQARIALADLFRQIPFDGGPAQTPIEVYEGAIGLLQTASDIAAASTNGQEGEGETYTAASYASIARVYRSLYFERGGDMAAFGQAADFAQQALAVDPNFSLAIRYQTPGNGNSVFSRLTQVQQITMDPDYASLLDPVSGEEDPRIQHTASRGTGVQGDSLFGQLKYPDLNADIPISRWQEAELIIAEYEILQGNLPAAVERINRVRTAAGLPMFASSDAQAIQAQLVYERKAEFWLEARRWPDMRYYNIVPERWFPAQKAEGVDRRYHVSLREQFNNPNL